MSDKPMTAKEYMERVAAWSASRPPKPALFVHHGPGALPGELYVDDGGQIRPYQGHAGFPWGAESAQRVADFINQVYPRESGEATGAFDALLTSYNAAALFAPYRNQDGSVTLTAAEAERVGAKVTAALKKAATEGFPWLVMLGKDQIVAGFFSEVAAVAYTNLSREPGKFRLVSRPSAPAARASSVATMPDPPSLADKPEAQVEAPGNEWDSTLAKIRELSELAARAYCKLQPWQVAWLETLFAKLRGAEWAVVNDSRAQTEYDYYVGTHQDPADAMKQAATLEGGGKVVDIDHLLKEFEKMQ